MYNKEYIKKLHQSIKLDLLNNQKDLLNRYHYYTHKYRSNDRLLDVNVGIFLNDNYQHTVQLYISNGNIKVREQFILDKQNNIINTNLTSKNYE